MGLVQIGYDFNVAVNGAWPSFVVNPLVFKATEPNQLKVSVCTNYIQEGSGSTSNMAVMEVTLPSGFTIDKDSLPALRRYKGVKRVDSMSGDTKVVLYFESLGRSEICPTISAYRTYRVIKQKPAYVLVYDYYDQSRRARSFYQVDPGSQCDIGDDSYVEDCGDRPTFLNFESFQFGTKLEAFKVQERWPISAVFYVAVISNVTLRTWINLVKRSSSSTLIIVIIDQNICWFLLDDSVRSVGRYCRTNF